MKTIEILLVEDSLGDIRLTQEVLKDSQTKNHLNVVTDGEQAMAFLRRKGQYNNAIRPDIILLDLNLPRKDGREVLSEIKDDDNLKHIPVVVLTTSDDKTDILSTYSLHANCYITKPADFDHFAEIIKTIEGFWFNTVNLPTS